MSSTMSVTATTVPSTGAPTKTPKPEKLAEAAGQFEAFLAGEMLKSVRDAGSGDWMGNSEDQSGSCLSEMAQEQFAQALAASGGLGIAKMVLKQLNPVS